MTFFVVSSQPSRMARRLYSSLGIAEESGGRDSGPSARRFFKQRVFGWNRWPKGDDGSGQCSKLSKTSSSSSSYLQQLMLLLGGTPPKIGQTADFMDLRCCCSHARLGCHNQRMSCGSRSQGRFFLLWGVFRGFPQVRQVPTIHTSTKT